MTGAVDPERADELVSRLEREVAPRGNLPAAALAVAHRGEVVCHAVLGDAGPDARFNLFSVSKAFVAAAVWRLLSDGRLRRHDRVGDLVADLAGGELADVTVEMLLTHTSGFPHAPLGPPDWDTRAGRRAKMAGWRLNWEPGSRFEYHASSAHWVLAAVIEEVTGLDHADAHMELVALPLDLPRLRLGATTRHPDDWSGVPPITIVGEAPDPGEMEAVTGVRVDLSELTDQTVLRYNEAAVRDVGVPGGGGVGSAADVALFYQALLHDPEGLWDPEVLRLGTQRVLHDFDDPMLGVPANRTLGLVLAGDDGHAARRGFGGTVSPRAFGHFGLGAQVAWADPDTGLSFCFLTNGHEVDLLAQGRRIHALSTRAGALLA